jgi:hypothetical protein
MLPADCPVVMNLDTISGDDGPLDIDRQVRRRAEDFRDHIWYNREVCNHCFSRVRRVEVIDWERYEGAGYSVPTHAPDAHQDRMPDVDAEHTPWQLPSERYGKTFCSECGGDTRARDGKKSLAVIKQHAVTLYRYTRDHTEFAIDHRRFAREAVRLKQRRDLQGYDSEIMAVAWARAVRAATATATAPDTAEA